MQPPNLPLKRETSAHPCRVKSEKGLFLLFLWNFTYLCSRKITIMESLKELYRIGSGPSSSHTMGPKRAAERFAERCRDVDAYRVTLYGSLAATGKGHLTDVAILSVLEPAAPTRIVWKPEVVLPFHPNGMLFEGLKGDEVVDSWTIYSVGGGALANEASRLETPRSIYPLSTISEIKEWCYHEGKTFWEYVSDCEGPEIWDYLDTVWETMCATIQRGLNNDGVLPGGLKVARKASTYWVKSKSYTDSLSSRPKSTPTRWPPPRKTPRAARS